MTRRHLLFITITLLCLIISAHAQNSSSCNGPRYIANTSLSADIRSCDTYRGDIIVGPDLYSLALGNIRNITGGLIITNAQKLVSVTGSALEAIGGRMRVEDVPAMYYLQLPRLDQVAMGITILNAPLLEFPNIGNGSVETSFLFIRNTSLKTLDAFDSAALTVLEVGDNAYLNKVTLVAPSSQALRMSFYNNGKNLTVSIPNLTTATNINISDLSSLDLPNLNRVTNSFTCTRGHHLSLTVPALNTVQGSLSVRNSVHIQSVSFPSLTSIGVGFSINNNTALRSLDGFPLLRDVKELFDLRGSFDSVSFPDLVTVNSNATILTSSKNKTICDYFQSLSASQVIRGKVNCSINVVTTGNNGKGLDDIEVNPTNDGNIPSMPRLSTGVIAGVIVAVVVLALIVLSILIWFCYYRPRQNLKPVMTIADPPEDTHELPQGSHYETAELHGDIVNRTFNTVSGERSYIYSNARMSPLVLRPEAHSSPPHIQHHPRQRNLTYELDTSPRSNMHMSTSSISMLSSASVETTGARRTEHLSPVSALRYKSPMMSPVRSIRLDSPPAQGISRVDGRDDERLS